jgi:hypothetical protein
MQREIVKLKVNSPLIVQLDFGPEGIQRDGKHGVQYQYTLNDDTCVMWVDGDVRAALMASGAEAGDAVEIVKTAREVRVKVISSDSYEPGEPAPAPAPRALPAPAPTPTHRAPAGPRAVPPARQITGSAANTAPTVYPMQEILENCFRIAARAVAAGIEESKAVGGPVDVTFEDVTKTAISLLIDRAKGGR